MKKIISLLVIGLLATSSLAFADVKVPLENAKAPLLPQGAKIQMHEKKAPLEAQAKKEKPDQAQREEMKAKHREYMSSIITKYAPTLLGDYKAAWMSHDAVHESLKALHESIRTSNKAKRTALIQTIKADVIAGKITKEEGKALIMAARQEFQAAREAVKGDIDILRDEFGMVEGTVKAMHEALKAAVAADDKAQVAKILQEKLAYLTKHIAFDEAKVAYFTAKLK